MKCLLFLFVALLGAGIASGQELTQEELDALFANAPSNSTATTPVLIVNNNYSSEIHHVTTEDGYVLEMHRIPGSPACPPAPGKPITFLMHGIEFSSSDWVIMGKDRGLAFLLADAGYDVWMGNARGNVYSRNHTPPLSSREFWNFTWHEIGYYDVPTMIDYALEKTGQDQVVYIGHSQGTTVFYVMTTTRPEYNDKIKAMFSLAPVCFMRNAFSPVLKAIAAVSNVQLLDDLIGDTEFLPATNFTRNLTANLCAPDVVAQFVCKTFLFALGGFDYPQIDNYTLPIIYGHFPAGASVGQAIHYGQEVVSNEFRQYDYGLIRNLAVYGQLTPPNYNLSLITAPVHLFYGDNDWLAAVPDVLRLSNELGNLAELYQVPIPGWAHFDFTYGKSAAALLYKRIIDALRTTYGLSPSCS